MGEAGLTAAAAPSCLRTTLYDVITALQTVVEPDEGDVIIATVVHWLRSGRIIFLRKGTVAAYEGVGKNSGRTLPATSHPMNRRDLDTLFARLDLLRTP